MKRNLFYTLLYGLSLFFLFLYCLTRFSIKTFGDLPFSQLLFHIMAGGAGEGITDSVFKQIIRWISIFILSSSVVTILYVGSINKVFREKFNKLILTIIYPIFNWKLVFVVSSILISIGSVNYANKRLHIMTYLQEEESTWFEAHYARLDPTYAHFIDGKKRNLIVLFLESMETSYRNPTVFGENLTPELVSLEQEGTTFRGYQRTPGSFFTIDGLSAQLLGVPVVVKDFDLHGTERYRAFLSKVPSLFNILKEHGYTTANFSGISKDFTSKEEYFKDHGITERFFKENWLAQGYSLEEPNKGRWDFNDNFLWERFKTWLSDKPTQLKPFAAVFETVDTHMPDGWVPTGQEKYGDLRDSIRQASAMTYRFIEWAKQQPWYDNTVIVIVGDHPFSDPPTSSFSRFSSQATSREIYNVFLNSPYLTPGSVISPKGGYTPMDIAPTILESMGIQFQSFLPDGNLSTTRLGLGTGLLSGAPTIISQEGIQPYFDELLNKRSQLYRSLFW